MDPGTVSDWLHKLGVNVYSGRHFVKQPDLKYGPQIVGLAAKGPAAISELIEERIWGVQKTVNGSKRLEKFCRFVSMHTRGSGVREIASALGVHRSTVAEWRKGTDQPYLLKLAVAASEHDLRPAMKLIPIHLTSGAAVQKDWIYVPTQIGSFEDITRVVDQLPTLPAAVGLADCFGIGRDRLAGMRLELFAYLLGMMAGDASKSGGKQERFASMNLELQLTLKHQSNERLGNFVCMCANSLGINMARIRDKQPSGSTRFGRQPSAAYRWRSERSPFLAWVFSVCLGLKWNQLTSYDRLRMDWIFGSPTVFRIRFVQALADSDATVKPSEVVITSVPNSEFVTKILSSLGMSSAHTLFEGGIALRSMVNRREASRLPILNEFVRGYRFEALMRPSVLPSRYGSVRAGTTP